MNYLPFSNFMQMRMKRVNKRLPLVLSALALIATFSAEAQVNSVSPLSMNGIGETGFGITPVYAGMANTGIAYVDRFTINPTNPAALTNMYFSTLQMGGRHRVLHHEIASTGENQYNYNTHFDYFGFGFKMNEWSALAVSLSPFSAKGYSISTQDTSSDFGVYEYRAVGSGGYDQLDVALAVEPVKWFSLGANVKYLFGEQTSSTKTIIGSSSFLSVSKSKQVGISDLTFDAGAQLRLPLSKGITLNAGAVYNYGGTLNSRQVQTQYTFINSGISENPVDTLYYNLSTNGTLVLPSALGFGFGLSGIKEDRPVHSWDFVADYKRTQWTAFAPFTADGEVAEHPIADDATRISAAFSFVPAYIIPQLSRTTNYFAVARYRIGFAQGMGQYYWDELPYSHTLYTAGVSLPIIYRSLAPGEQKASFLDISIGRGTLWDGAASSLKESYWNFNIGITFNDKWFQKFRYR